jgi:MFS transporter, SHS family, sialic acid transporter
MAITSIVMRVAAADLLPPGTEEGEIGKWFGWLVCAFLFGAASGGYLFGLVGDRVGRARAMAASICCYSIFSGLTYFATDPWTLLVLRFLTCMGIGGMWPSGIALLSEAWSGVARPVLAGIMGTAANVGICCFALLTTVVYVEQDGWRWTMLAGASPLILGLLSLAIVPESPRWLAVSRRNDSGDAAAGRVGLAEIFTPPVLKTTLLGILLGTIPLFGGWGVSNWANAWASEAGDKPTASASADATTDADPTLKSKATIARSLPGSISSLLGGALAFYFGRKRTYFFLSLCALVCTQMLFRVESPQGPTFLFWMGALGFFSGFFFGWLPLCLPELFPTRVRSTGAGVSFNWGRILTGVGVLASAIALKQAFQGRYADVGQLTGLIYAVGMVAILLTPPMSDSALED